MFVFMKKPWRFSVAAALLAAWVMSAAVMPNTVWAQNRTLPDFTDLVEQVGPSVVNIRTSEKVKVAAGGGGGVDEQMLEFFRRFGIPVPPNVPRGPEPSAASPSQMKINPRAWAQALS